MEILVDAIHEAGHAVVAAYLRIPFQHATVTPKMIDGFETGGHVKFIDLTVRELSKSRITGSWRLRSAEEMSTVVGIKQRKRAIVTLAGRAADEFRSVERSEDAYGGDEDNLRVIAVSLGISQDGFAAWRLNCLDQARQIVSLPHVRLAIPDVAFELSFSSKQGVKRVPSRAVRESLRYAEGYVAKKANLMCNEAAANHSTRSSLASLCEIAL